MLRDREDSFPLLPFSPQCGHLYRVRLIIPYPQTWQAISVTLKACVCMCEFHTCVCVCVPLFGCAFKFSSQVFACVCMSVLFLLPCVSLRVRACLAPASVCVVERHRQHVCLRVGIYDTFYLFTVVPQAVMASPRSNQASLMVLISDMSQMLCLTGV